MSLGDRILEESSINYLSPVGMNYLSGDIGGFVATKEYIGVGDFNGLAGSTEGSVGPKCSHLLWFERCDNKRGPHRPGRHTINTDAFVSKVGR